MTNQFTRARKVQAAFACLFASVTASAASAAPNAGYCWFNDANALYVSKVFQTDSSELGDWKRQWNNFLVRSEHPAYHGTGICRAWRGDDALTTATSEQAKVPIPYTRSIVVDWIIREAIGAGTGARPDAIADRDIAKGATVKKGTRENAPPEPDTKWVIVNGQRLSPEVAARNQAAAEEYQRKFEEHSKAMAKSKADEERHKQSVAEAAAARQQHERQLAVNAQQQLEYRKALAKPPGVNAAYRGFTGPNCEFARRSATNGAGTSSGTKFSEVTSEQVGGTCVVQGWWWNTTATGASRQ